MPNFINLLAFLGMIARLKLTFKLDKYKTKGDLSGRPKGACTFFYNFRVRNIQSFGNKTPHEQKTSQTSAFERNSDLSYDHLSLHLDILLAFCIQLLTYSY